MWLMKDDRPAGRIALQPSCRSQPLEAFGLEIGFEAGRFGAWGNAGCRNGQQELQCHRFCKLEHGNRSSNSPVEPALAPALCGPMKDGNEKLLPAIFADCDCPG